MYIRFVIPAIDEDSHQRQGLFQVASALRNAGKLAVHEEDWLREELEWLNEHLPVPERLEDPGTERALSWFRATATEAIARMRSLAALLEEHDHRVQMLQTDDPGTIIYKDDWQVVAFPPRLNRVRKYRPKREPKVRPKRW